MLLFSNFSTTYLFLIHKPWYEFKGLHILFGLRRKPVIKMPVKSDGKFYQKDFTRGKQTIQLLPFYCIKTSTHSCYFFQKHWELQKCFLWKASGGCDPSVFFDHSAWFFPVIFSLVWLIIQGFRLSQAKVICIVLIHEAMLCFSAWSASLGKVVAQRHSTGATISIKGYTTPNTYL